MVRPDILITSNINCITVFIFQSHEIINKSNIFTIIKRGYASAKLGLKPKPNQNKIGLQPRKLNQDSISEPKPSPRPAKNKISKSKNLSPKGKSSQKGQTSIIDK